MNERIDLSSVYEEIREQIAKMDLSSLWPGFTACRFGLYTETDCFFDGTPIPKPEEFVANTALEYQGEYAAIWNLSEVPEDRDRLTASLVHEMFHAFQNTSGESRWADDTAALFDYRYSVDNLSIKLREAALMREILVRKNTAVFPELLSLRRLREEKHPAEYDYEARIEQIEGTATLVELKALARLAPEKAAEEWESLFSKILDPSAYIPVRIVSYSVGAAFLACLEACSAIDIYRFEPVPFAVRAIEGAKPAEARFSPDPRVAKAVDAYLAGESGIVRRALEKNEIVLQGSYRLCSLNLWDAWSDGRYAVSNVFVAYYDGPEVKSLRGDFVVEMGRDRIIKTVYRQ